MGIELNICDRVKILNRKLFLETEGTVAKFGKQLVTVQLNSGKKTIRKSTNLHLLE